MVSLWKRNKSQKKREQYKKCSPDRRILKIESERMEREEDELPTDGVSIRTYAYIPAIRRHGTVSEGGPTYDQYEARETLRRMVDRLGGVAGGITEAWVSVWAQGGGQSPAYADRWLMGLDIKYDHQEPTPPQDYAEVFWKVMQIARAVDINFEVSEY